MTGFKTYNGLAALLALGLTLSSGPVLAAQTFPLESVDFVSAGRQTEILLHTGSIVPVHKVLISDNKLVIDIDGVSADGTVKTNFEGAENVSHVVIQPLSKEKIRLIVRGEELTDPKIGFNNPSAPITALAHSSINLPPADDLAGKTQAALGEVQRQMTQPATLGVSDIPAEPNAGISAAVDAPPNTLPVEPEPEPLSPEMIADGDVRGALPTAKPLGLTPSMGGEEEAVDFFTLLKTWNLDAIVKFSVLGVLLLGLGLLIRRKLDRLRNPHTLEDMLLVNQKAAPNSGNRIGFREMADAYRKDAKPTPQESAEKKPYGSRPQQAGAPIGLRSLGRLDGDEVAAPQAQAVQQPIPPAAPPIAQQPIQTPAPQKQVLNQYQKQAAPASAKPAAKAPATQPQSADALLRQEIARAQEIQQKTRLNPPRPNTAPAGQAPVNRAPVNQAKMAQGKRVETPSFPRLKSGGATAPTAAPNNGKRPAAKPAPAGNAGPLPGNPEVLNFLRNVADLMEKEGKPEMASRIQKNIKPIS